MYSVAEPNDLEVEAARLGLALVVNSPNVWRGRGVATGGFVTAAAAASLVGLSQAADRASDPAIAAMVVAAVFYTAAVVALLVAGVWPAPRSKDKTQKNYLDQAQDWADEEAKQVRCIVLVGAGLAALAIAATSTGAVLLSLDPKRTVALVVVTDAADRLALESVCPRLPSPFAASVTQDGSGSVSVRVLGRDCGGAHPSFRMPASSLVWADTGDR